MKEINGKSIIVFFILLGIFLNCPIFRTQGQNLTESTVRGGFIVPEYDSKNKKRSVLYGEEASYLSNRIYLIKGLKIEVFNDEEKVIWTATAPICYFNYNNRTAYSDGELALNSEDGQLFISGTGFEWRQNEAALTISNNILTRVRVFAKSTGPQRGPLRQEFEITADKFRFKSRESEAEYKGNVRIKEIYNSQRRSNLMNLSCGELLIKFLERLGGIQEITAKVNVTFDDKENQAFAEKAVFIATNNIVILEGQARWRAPEAEGTADSLILDRQQNEFTALGNTHTRSRTNVTFGLSSVFPSTKNLKKEGETENKPVEISAGKIKGKKTIEQGKEVQHFNIYTNVIVTQGDNYIKTDQLLFSYSTNDALLNCYGNTLWKTPEMIGKAEHLSYTKGLNLMSASGNVEIKYELPRTPSAETSVVNTNKRVVEIYGNVFNYHLTNISIRDSVRLIDESFELICGSLFLTVVPPGSIDKFNAEENVILKQRQSEKGYWVLNSKYLRGESGKDKPGIARIETADGVTANYYVRLTNNIVYEKLKLKSQEAEFILSPPSNVVNTIKMKTDVQIVQNSIQTNLQVVPDLKLNCNTLNIKLDDSGEFISSASADGQVCLEKMAMQTVTNIPVVLTCESLRLRMQPKTNLVDYIEALQKVRIDYGNNSALASHAFYYGTNELVELRGNPRLNLSPETIAGMSKKHEPLQATGSTTGTEKPAKKQVSPLSGVKTIEITGAETLMWFMKDNRFQALGPYKVNISLSSTNAEKTGIFNFRK
jgi:lipopolysaccharide export system protein LptA